MLSLVPVGKYQNTMVCLQLPKAYQNSKDFKNFYWLRKENAVVPRVMLKICLPRSLKMNV